MTPSFEGTQARAKSSLAGHGGRTQRSFYSFHKMYLITEVVNPLHSDKNLPDVAVPSN